MLNRELPKSMVKMSMIVKKEFPRDYIQFFDSWCVEKDKKRNDDWKLPGMNAVNEKSWFCYVTTEWITDDRKILSLLRR
jgi:hypothetical protein